MANKKCGTCCPQAERPMDGLRAGNSLLWDRMADDNQELHIELGKVRDELADIENDNRKLHTYAQEAGQEAGKLYDELVDARSALDKAVAELAKEKEWSSMRSVAHRGDIASFVAEIDQLRAELEAVRAKNRRLAREIGPVQDQTELANKNWALHIELADANNALEKAVAELGILAPYVTAGLLPALDACGSVLLYGQQKYPANDWANLCPEEHNAAILRHIGSKAQYDHESEQLHAAHTAARALMALGTELPYA